MSPSSPVGTTRPWVPTLGRAPSLRESSRSESHPSGGIDPRGGLGSRTWPAGPGSSASAPATMGRRSAGTREDADRSRVVGGHDAEVLRIRLDLDRAGIRFRQGQYGACVRGALPAAAAAERIGERALLANAYYLLHAAYGDLGSPEVARYRDLALPIYEELGDLVGQGNVLNNLGIEAYFEGRWDDALELYARSKDSQGARGPRRQRGDPVEQRGGDPVRPGPFRRSGGAPARRAPHLGCGWL